MGSKEVRLILLRFGGILLFLTVLLLPHPAWAQKKKDDPKNFYSRLLEGKWVLENGTIKADINRNLPFFNKGKIGIRDFRMIQNDLLIEIDLDPLKKEEYYILELSYQTTDSIFLMPEHLDGEMIIQPSKKWGPKQIRWLDLPEEPNFALGDFQFTINAKKLWDCGQSTEPKFHWLSYTLISGLGAAQLLTSELVPVDRKYQAYRKAYFEAEPGTATEATEEQYREANQAHHTNYVLNRSGIGFIVAGVAAGVFDYLFLYKSKKDLYEVRCGNQTTLNIQPDIHITADHPFESSLGLKFALTF